MVQRHTNSIDKTLYQSNFLLLVLFIGSNENSIDKGFYQVRFFLRFFFTFVVIQTNTCQSKVDADMDSPHEQDEFKCQFSRFGSVSTEDKDKIFKERKSLNTNRATATYVKCLNDYLNEKQLPAEDQIPTVDLPQILSDFYVEVRKKKSTQNNHKVTKGGKVIPPSPTGNDYKNTSLMCIRAALNRHFKSTRSIDIIANEQFIQCNEMFKGVTKKGKREGRGEIDSRPPIEPEDLQKIHDYFQQNMRSPPNARKLQEMMLFNVIYYGGRRGRENLRFMSKGTFEIGQDPDGRRYIHQIIKEHDKNYKENDFQPSNEARIYEMPGKFLSMLHLPQSYIHLTAHQTDSKTNFS